MVEDEAALDADESSLMAGLRDDMARLLERLPAREAAVMRMRYGLEGEVYTLDDIGSMLKVGGGAGVWVGVWVAFWRREGWDRRALRLELSQ